MSSWGRGSKETREGIRRGRGGGGLESSEVDPPARGGERWINRVRNDLNSHISSLIKVYFPPKSTYRSHAVGRIPATGIYPLPLTPPIRAGRIAFTLMIRRHRGAEFFFNIRDYSSDSRYASATAIGPPTAKSMRTCSAHLGELGIPQCISPRSKVTRLTLYIHSRL